MEHQPQTTDPQSSTSHRHHHRYHHHHHHHRTSTLPSQSASLTPYTIAIILNMLFVIVEAGMGAIGNSLGLIADAGHNLGDVFSLLLALIAVRLAMTHGTKRFTYGYRKSSVLISLLNAIILLVAVGGIMLEGIQRILSLTDSSLSTNSFNNGSLITWTAGIGIIINGLTAWMLHSGQHDINARGAYLHMLADTLVSVGVVLSGIIITYTSWTFIDPLISIVIAAIILVSTWKLLSESIRMSIDAVPKGVNTDEIQASISSVEGVKSIHHLHIWAISTTENALTAHIVIEDRQLLEQITDTVKHRLRRHNIHHSTLELETPQSHCREYQC